MRLFIGLSLPDLVSSHLSTMRGSLPDIHWHDPDTYHIALCFIGEVQNYGLINDIDLALEKINFPQFELSIQGVHNYTTPSYEDHLCASVVPTPSLLQLKKKIEFVIQQFDIKLQKQRFTPHVSLGKGFTVSEEQISNWLYNYNLFKIEPFQICQFSLFSSYPGKDQPHYIVESNYLLR